MSEIDFTQVSSDPQKYSQTKICRVIPRVISKPQRKLKSSTKAFTSKSSRTSGNPNSFNLSPPPKPHLLCPLTHSPIFALLHQGLLKDRHARRGEDREGSTLKLGRSLALQSEPPVNRAVPQRWQEISNHRAAH